MLFKFNVNGVVITETAKDGRTTTLKIDSVSFENEATADEGTALLNGLVDVFKTVRPAKKNNRHAKRFHIVKTHDYPNNGSNILWYIWDRKDNKYFIKVGNTESDIMTSGYFKQCITEHKNAGRIIAEYDCNNFRL